MASDSYTPSAFRLAERKYKFYKKPKHAPDYSEVIDFSDLSHNSSNNQQHITIHRTIEHKGRSIPVYSLSNKAGFYFIPQALSIKEQAHWAHRSLSNYAQPPNYSNLGVLQDNLWQQHLIQTPSPMSKLRWVTLGYHYNWTTNVYENTKERITPFPNELVALCKEHAQWCGFDSFEAQAGIVNYYHVNASMMKAHQDESEFTFEQPILSYCLGSSCIFLLGDVSTDVAPTAIFMRSGDLMVMGGHSRVFYHGVARILPESCPEALIKELCDNGKITVGDYLKEFRVNLNIRQVFSHSAPNVFLSDEQRKELLKQAMDKARG